MQVKWLAVALRNLDHEAEFIAADDPQAARQVVSRVLDAVAVLALQPGIGRPGRVPGTRANNWGQIRINCLLFVCWCPRSDARLGRGSTHAHIFIQPLQRHAQPHAGKLYRVPCL